MKRIVKYIFLTAILLVLIPLSINYVTTNGIMGFKPFVTEFNNQLWFEFWYNYIPAIIAFSGTIYAVLQANKQNLRLQDFEKKNFAFSIMPEIKLNLNEAHFELINSPNGLDNHHQEMELFFYDKNKRIKTLIDELVGELLEATKPDYYDIIQILKEMLLADKINVQTNYLYNIDKRKHVTESNIVNKWEYITNEMSNTKRALEIYNKFILLYKLKNNELPKLRTRVKGLVIIAEENSGVLERSEEFFYCNLLLKIRNYSKTDIISIKVSTIEIQIDDCEMMIYHINSEKEVIIHQNRDGDVPNLDEYVNVYVHLYNSKINFTYDKDATFKFTYEITTALGYRYHCVNIISYCMKDRDFSKISFANTIPII